MTGSIFEGGEICPMSTLDKAEAVLELRHNRCQCQPGQYRAQRHEAAFYPGTWPIKSLFDCS